MPKNALCSSWRSGRQSSSRCSCICIWSLACRYRVDIFLQRTASAIASQILSNTARNEEHRALEEALERIKVLQSRCAENEEMLRQKDAAHNALIQKVAETSRTQAPCHAPSSPRLNAFDDFNSDLKLQAEAGRALAVALRQQIGDEQERAAVLQRQLAREREQVRLSVFCAGDIYVFGEFLSACRGLIMLHRRMRCSCSSLCPKKYGARRSSGCMLRMRSKSILKLSSWL